MTTTTTSCLLYLFLSYVLKGVLQCLHCFKIKKYTPTAIVPVPPELWCPVSHSAVTARSLITWLWAITGFSGQAPYVWVVTAKTSNWLTVTLAINRPSLLSTRRGTPELQQEWNGGNGREEYNLNIYFKAVESVRNVLKELENSFKPLFHTYSPQWHFKKKNTNPGPLIFELFKCFKESHNFAKLYLREADNLICIKEGVGWKIAFTTWNGHCKYLAMPFSLCYAPDLQYFVNDILSNVL